MTPLTFLPVKHMSKKSFCVVFLQQMTHIWGAGGSLGNRSSTAVKGMRRSMNWHSHSSPMAHGVSPLMGCRISLSSYALVRMGTSGSLASTLWNRFSSMSL